MDTESHPICRQLLLDHQRLVALVGSLLEAVAAGDRPATLELWRQFDAGLLSQMETEERELIPLLMKSWDRDARALIEEHKHIRSRLQVIGKTVVDGTAAAATIRGFADELRAHASHEDTLVYRLNDVEFDPAGQQALLAALVDGASTK